MVFDALRTDYTATENARLEVWRLARGHFDAKISAGNVTPATAELTPAFAALDPLDAEAVNELRDATIAAIDDATSGARPLDVDLVKLYDTLTAMLA